MREPTAENRTLTAEDVRTEAAGLLREHLPLSADGYKLTTERLLDVLLHAAGDWGDLDEEDWQANERLHGVTDFIHAHFLPLQADSVVH